MYVSQYMCNLIIVHLVKLSLSFIFCKIRISVFMLALSSKIVQYLCDITCDYVVAKVSYWLIAKVSYWLTT